MGNDMLTPAQRVRQNNALRAAATVPPEVRALIGQDALDSQKTILPLPYWSRVRFQGVRSGSGPYTFTTTQGTRKAFAYKVGDDTQIAGYASGTVATPAYTNLIAGGTQTNDNSDYIITGIGIQVGSGSEPRLVKALQRALAISFSLSGSNQQLLGRLERFPAPGGLFGLESTTLESSDPAGTGLTTFGPLEGQMQNGNPIASSFYRLGQFPLRWNAVGSGKKDTNFTLLFQTFEDITLTGAASVSSHYTAPASIYADFIVELQGIQISDRSSNI